MRTATPIAAALLKATLALCTLFSQAQNVHYGESFGLNSTLSPGESHEYHASHYIDLTGGFHSEPQNHNYTLLELDSEGYGVYPPEVGMLDNYDCVVGALGGTVDISAMGGLVYSIPLELPSGINGMQPNLSITYNSQAGNGLLGWGWDLTGLSSITRTGQTLYHDDKMTAADLSWNDRFLLDGKRLVKVADYTDSVEYRTEQDEMSRIMAYMRYEPGGLFGLGTKVLDHFVVWKANGLIMEYGATQDSWIDPQHGGFQAVCWLLNKATDRNGNSIVYQYDESQANGTHPVDLIEYTVNEAQSVQAQFSVKFNYSNNRLDSERYYIAGNQVGMSHLLNSIVVSSKLANKNLIEYGFSYIFDYYRAYNNLTRMSMKSYDENGQMEKVRATAFERNPSYAEHLRDCSPKDMARVSVRRILQDKGHPR